MGLVEIKPTKLLFVVFQYWLSLKFTLVDNSKYLIIVFFASKD